jgi:DNA/RNA-binding domain of Phe-tRNA-synthetase-like protein
MIPIHIDVSWPEGARMGFLEARGLPSLATHPELERERVNLEAELRARYAGMDRQTLRDLPVMRVFAEHDKPHGKTYHVLLQLESMALKGKSIPSRLCAVTALFMAELKHGLVAAGHDLNRLMGPLRMARSQGGEQYTAFGGKPITLPSGDLTLHHAPGLLSSILYGPGQDTPIQPTTTDVLYTLYAPEGVPPGTLEAQLQSLEQYIRCFAPEAYFASRQEP